jgi:hypothetical protein
MSSDGDGGGGSRDGIAVGVVGGLEQGRPRDSASATNAGDCGGGGGAAVDSQLSTVASPVESGDCHSAGHDPLSHRQLSDGQSVRL